MNRVDVRLAKVTGQPERQFEIVIVDDTKEMNIVARLCARLLRYLKIID